MRAEEESGWGTGVAFLAGALIGAAAALLYAPYTGEKTRKMIRNYAEDTSDDILERIQDAKDTLDDAIDQGMKFYNDKKAALASAFENGEKLVKSRSR